MDLRKYRHQLQIAGFCVLTLALYALMATYKVQTAPLDANRIAAVDDLQNSASLNGKDIQQAEAILRYQSIGNLSRGETTIRQDIAWREYVAENATPTPPPAPGPMAALDYSVLQAEAPMNSIVLIPPLNPEEAGRPVVFFGDSLSVDAVQAVNTFWEFSSAFNRYDLVGMGLNGCTTKQGVGRVWEVVALRPRTVFLMLGTNDMFGGESISGAITNMAYIVDTIRGNLPDCNVVIQAIPPFGQAALDRMWAASNYNVSIYNQGLRNLAVSRGVSFVDIGALYRDANGLLAPYYTNDGVHITIYNFGNWLDKLISLGFV
jgi:lysophospholipase L1-like esterase